MYAYPPCGVCCGVCCRVVYRPCTLTHPVVGVVVCVVVCVVGLRAECCVQSMGTALTENMYAIIVCCTRVCCSRTMRIAIALVSLCRLCLFDSRSLSSSLSSHLSHTHLSRTHHTHTHAHTHKTGTFSSPFVRRRATRGTRTSSTSPPATAPSPPCGYP